jgi:hypothetical protein
MGFMSPTGLINPFVLEKTGEKLKKSQKWLCD